jgi:hypothetical protein
VKLVWLLAAGEGYPGTVGATQAVDAAAYALLYADTLRQRAADGEVKVGNGEVAISQRYIETNGIRLWVAEAGQGPLVLLCHGFPESW